MCDEEEWHGLSRGFGAMVLARSLGLCKAAQIPNRVKEIGKKENEYSKR